MGNTKTMSEFARMPKAWHDSLDASLPKIYNIEFMTGSKNERIMRRLKNELLKGPVKKSEFCKAEGIFRPDLNTALNSMPDLIWEDGGKVGLM